MTDGEDFVVNVDLDLAASDILTRGDEFARFEGRRKEVRAMATGRRIWVVREHVSYVEEYVARQPSVCVG
jgi:hypothetical protein